MVSVCSDKGDIGDASGGGVTGNESGESSDLLSVV